MAWPRDSQADLIAFYGDPARDAVAPHLVKVIPPFRMTYDGKPIPHLSFHRLAAPALERALQRVWDYYGHDQAKVDALGISKTAGTYNKRFISGTTRWSNHAFGAAIDINAEENGFYAAGNIPIPMIAAFKAEGARWGGDYKGRTDPMHFEFCASGEPARTFEQWLAFYGVPAGSQGVPMQPSNFERVHPLIAKWEGGYSNDPDDAGGPTNFGITQDRLSEARGRQVSAADVQALTYPEALDIFRRYYWTPLHCDELPIALAVMTYNAGVNSGPARGARFLQQALNRQIAALDEDGQIGPLTIKAARECPNIAKAVDDYSAIYEAYYRSLPKFSKFGKGWLNRLNDITPQARALSGERPPVIEGEILDPLPKPEQPVPAGADNILPLLLLLLLTKEIPTMPTDNAPAPGQDLLKLLLPLILNAAVSGKPIDANEILRLVLASVLGVPALTGPSPPATDPAATPAPASLPQTQNELLLELLKQLAAGSKKPAESTTPPSSGAPAAPAADKINNGSSVLGFIMLALAAIGQATGLAPVVGESANAVAPAATGVSLLTTGGIAGLGGLMGVAAPIIGPLINFFLRGVGRK